MKQKNLEISDLLEIYGNLLTTKQFTLVKYYYYDDFSLAEIAENEGITRQAVRDTLMRAVAQLEEYEKNLHIYEKRSKMLRKVQAIRSNAQNIDLNENSDNKTKVLNEGRIKEIIEFCDSFSEEV